MKNYLLPKLSAHFSDAAHGTPKKITIVDNSAEIEYFDGVIKIETLPDMNTVKQVKILYGFSELKIEILVVDRLIFLSGKDYYGKNKVETI